MSKKLKSSESESDDSRTISKSFEVTHSYPDAALNIALDTIDKKRQALVFCNTKRGAESQAEKIAQKVKLFPGQEQVLLVLAESILVAVQSPTKQCRRLSMCVQKGIAFHHSGLNAKQREIIETAFRESILSIICATPTLAMGMDLPAYRSIIRDLKRYSHGTSWAMSEIPVLEYEQMAGRAGRPGKEKNGEAICIAQTESEKKHIVEKYLLGDPEEIYSKLAVEPVLRTYVLSLIASEIVRDLDELYAFFNDTFYAWQYGDTQKLHRILDKMIGLLTEWGFLELTAHPSSVNSTSSNSAALQKKSATAQKKNPSTDFISAADLVDGSSGVLKSTPLRATPIGARVAQLYLDPYTAFHLIDSLDKAEQQNKPLQDLPLLHLLSTTFEIRPLLSVKQGELDEIDAVLVEHEDSFYVPSPSTYSHDYDEFLQSVKTAIALGAWIEEAGEDKLLEEYNMTPGDLQAKRDIVDWLLYSLIELCKLLKWQRKITDLERLRLRVEYGAREDLLPLLRLKGIGRIRARKLVASKIRTLEEVRRIDFATLKLLLGEKISIDIKDQVGQKVAPSDLKVAPNKRKGQINLNDFGK